MTSALAGIKVIDVSQVAAVPMAARYLGDFGADVIHIEHPVMGDSMRVTQEGMSKVTGIQSDINYMWENYNRNKRSMTLDLSQEIGQKILYGLVKEADVYLTNMRPFELERFHLEYDDLSQLNPGLIYGALTGYGTKGAGKNTPAYDHTSYWARSGIAHRQKAITLPNTEENSPPGFMPSFGDHMAGMNLACGIMTALFMRERTGIGQKVDVSLLHTGIYQISVDIAGALVTNEDCYQISHGETVFNPLVTYYRSKDNRWMLLSGIRSERYWPRICKAINRQDLADDPRYDTKDMILQNAVAVRNMLAEIFRSRTLEEWKPRLDDAEFPWAPVQNLPEVIHDPQARANDFFISYDHPTCGLMEGVANPVKLSNSPEAVRMPAPEFSQHTEEILLENGYTWEEIAQFKANNIIA